MIQIVTFVDTARRYVESRCISPVYADTLLRRAAALQQHCGASAVAQVLTESHLNAFLASLEGKASPYTIKGYRGDLLTLWRAAADDELAAYPAMRKVRRPRLSALVVECYSIDEARSILAAARMLRGGLSNGLARKLYWPAMILAAWETGLRRGDLWRIGRNSIRPDGTMLVAQSKTGGLVVCRMRASTVAALDAIGGQRPLAWPLSPWSFGEQFQGLVKDAGVNRGTFRFLRRSSGSYVEMQQPGAGFKHLGHGSDAVFKAHYDARLGADLLPMPPEL